MSLFVASLVDSLVRLSVLTTTTKQHRATGGTVVTGINATVRRTAQGDCVRVVS